MRRDSVNRLSVVFALLLLASAHLAAQASVVYVDLTATGGDNGTSWDDAYVDLQSALGTAAPPDSIWVAAGTYYPSATGNRDSTFQLVDGVAVYGGFAGVETSLSERDWATNVTILSGDIGEQGVDSDNSYHVVTASGTGSTAVLDGLTITKGNADYPDVGDARTQGAGMHNIGGGPTVANVTFLENASNSHGGAVYNDGASTTFTNVVFESNWAGGNGGGIFSRMGGGATLLSVTFSNNSADKGGGVYNTLSSPALINVVFTGNEATDRQGGGLYNYMGSNTSMTNVTFSNNVAAFGGGMFNLQSDPEMVNTIVSGNYASIEEDEIYNWFSSTDVSYSLIRGGLPAGCVDGGNNVTGNPLFVDKLGGDLRLSGPGSVAFDAGSNAAPDLPSTDRDGNPRIMNGTVDIGAYELQAEGGIVVASPSSVVFEEVPVSETTCDTIEVINVGDETCMLTGIYGCSDSPFSLDISMTAESLDPGDTTEVVVCVTPEAAGSDTCAVTIESNAWNPTVTVQVRLEIATGVATPTPFRIVSVMPNPFNPSVAVHFALPGAMAVTAEIYSVSGARVRVLAEEERFSPGDNRLVWDGLTDLGSRAASGVYFIRLETSEGVRVGKAVLVK